MEVINILRLVNKYAPAVPLNIKSGVNMLRISNTTIMTTGCSPRELRSVEDKDFLHKDF